MNKRSFRSTAIVVLVAITSTASFAHLSAPLQQEKEARPTVRLGKLPVITLPPPSPPTAEEVGRIKMLIAGLAKIESLDFGFSPTISPLRGGVGFAPIADSDRADASVLMDRYAAVELVKLGPRALPFLLDALEDKTPTRLTIKRVGYSMWIEFGTELSGNPANPAERKALAALPQSESDNPESENERSHTITEGDVCFVIIGQIVGRPYQAAWGQPSGGVLITSPTRNPVIAKAVCTIWSSRDPAQHLLDGLLLDYSTQAVHRGSSFDDWKIASDFQVDAAMRLLYYFPQQSTPMIAERLRRLHVQGVGPGEGSPSNRKQMAASEHRDWANGVHTVDLVKFVAWCKEPAIRSALADIFRRTTDPDLLVASLPGMENKDRAIIRKRLEGLLDRQPAEDDGAYGDGCNLLIALGQYGGPEAKAAFQKYLSVPTVQRRFTMAQVLRETRSEWAVEFLSPLLTDRRTFDSEYTVHPGQNEQRLRIRVCDEAARVLAHVRKDLSFKLEGSYANLDDQIALLQQKLKLSGAKQ